MSTRENQITERIARILPDLIELNNVSIRQAMHIYKTYLEKGKLAELPEEIRNISNWDVSRVTDMSRLFYKFTVFNQDISRWDVSNVTDMSHMFESAKSFNQPLNDWNVSNVQNMEVMFLRAESFNQPLDNWNVSNVRKMKQMFQDARRFNQPLNNWDVGNVRYMFKMFWNAESFNQPLNNWNVGNVRYMGGMFQDARRFNQPLNNWNVGNVKNMSEMFYSASAFNQPLNNWNVGNVRDMNDMFYSARSFNQDLTSWGNRLNPNVIVDDMFENSGMINLPQWYLIREPPIVAPEEPPSQEDIDKYNRIIENASEPPQHFDPNERCPICLEPLNYKYFAEKDPEFNCGKNCDDIVKICENQHMMHRGCILDMCQPVTSRDKCPTCRQPLIPFLKGSPNKSCVYFEHASAVELPNRDEELPLQGGRRRKKIRKTRKVRKTRKAKSRRRK
jgi:surface protein